MQFVSRISLLVTAVLPMVLGCTQSGTTTLPWQRQVPGGPPLATGSSDQLSYLAQLERRAQQQQKYAEAERRRLAEMAELDQQKKEQLRLAQLEQQARQGQSATQQHQSMLSRHTELERRAANLDANNRDLHAQLAQSQQNTKLLEDQLDLLRRRLDDTTRQLASARQAGQASDQRLQALQASARRRSGASITANSSLKRDVTAVMVPGMDIRQDGDLVRISLPADQLFLPGTATLHQGAQPYLDQVADVIHRNYARQMVGIEAHTDRNTTLAGTLWRSQHQVTVAQAMAVFEQMSTRHRIDSRQLFVLGHGANHPVASGGTPQGQQLNRRVEIVIYPELHGS